MGCASMNRTFRIAVSEAADFQSRYPSLFSGAIVEVDQNLFDVVANHRGVVIDGPLGADDVPPPNAQLIRDRESIYHITYMLHQSFCLQRLSIMKELAHCLTDDPSVRADSPGNQLKHATTHLTNFDPDALLSSEQFCYHLAFELMIPPHRREELERMKAEGSSAFDIAVEVRVPQFCIEEAMFRSALWAVSTLVRNGKHPIGE